MSGTTSLLNLLTSGAMQYPDYGSTIDMFGERTNHLTKSTPLNKLTAPTMLNKERQMVDTPGVSPLLRFRMGGTKLSHDKESLKMNHKKLASIIYRNGHHNQTEKTATYGQEILDVLKKPTLGVVASAIGAGALAKHYYDQYQQGKNAEQVYKEMFNKFPSLADADQAKVNDYWGVMQQYAPTMTQNPIVAGQFIKNIIDFGVEGVDHPTLKSILDVQAAQHNAFNTSPMGISDIVRLA